METVERSQYQAALAITGAWQGSNRSKLYEELGWESLSDRRWCRRILQIHKIKNNMIPSYLRDKLPPNRRFRFRYLFLNKNTIKLNRQQKYIHNSKINKTINSQTLHHNKKNSH